MTSNALEDVCPEVASTGYTVWMRYESGHWNIYRRNLSGGEFAITTQAGDDMFPRLNSLGRTVWVRPSAATGDYDLWYRNNSGGSETAITTDGSVVVDPDSEARDFQVDNAVPVAFVA